MNLTLPKLLLASLAEVTVAFVEGQSIWSHDKTWVHESMSSLCQRDLKFSDDVGILAWNNWLALSLRPTTGA